MKGSFFTFNFGRAIASNLKPLLSLWFLLLSSALLLLSLSFSAKSLAEPAQQNSANTANTTKAKKQSKSKKAKKPYVIESLVQGSQEQPKVIYVTPWQVNEKKVFIKAQKPQVKLPKLAPINPTEFKKRLLK